MQVTINSLRQQQVSYEQLVSTGVNQDYKGAVREFKYQEALFENYARQFELASVDEPRDVSIFQALVHASAPERLSGPRLSWFRYS